MKTSEVLENAADILERDGWCQGNLVRPNGSRCSIGAIRKALRDEMALKVRSDPDYIISPAMTHYQEKLAIQWVLDAAEATGSVMHLPHWNDQPDRTKSEVLDAFRKAAKLARIDEES